MTRLVRILLIFAIVAMTGAVYGQSTNLLQNGDAEHGQIGQPAPGWSPAGYDGVNYPNTFPYQTVAGGRNGGKAIQIEKPGNYQWVYIQQWANVSLDSPCRYTLRVWLRADKPMPEGVDVVIIPANPTSLPTALPTARERVGVTAEWKEYSASTIVPESRDMDGKPNKVDLRAIIQLYAAGPLMIDDLSFTRSSLTPQEKSEAATSAKLGKTSGIPSPVGTSGGIIARPDGTLLGFSDDFTVSISTDGGKTWGTREQLAIPGKTDHISGAIQMRDGTIGVWTESWGSPVYFWTSSDGGKTWSTREQINSVGAPLAGNVMFETRDGDLILPMRVGHTVHGGLWENVGGGGRINGKWVMTEGHAHALEMDVTYVMSKLKGSNSWRRSEGDVIIWKDDGEGGMWPCDEPNVAQLKHGRLIMFIRTTLGRIYQSFSTDKGLRWSYPTPTILPSSYSPCSLKTIPDNDFTRKAGYAGDLLCVWNNVSHEEVKKGWRRGILCSAISKDDGKTWIHVRTIDTGGLPPVSQIAKLSPPQMTRSDKDVGELPIPFGLVHYADVTFNEGTVIVKYGKQMIRPKLDLGNRIRVYPLDWFYGK